MFKMDQLNGFPLSVLSSTLLLSVSGNTLAAANQAQIEKIEVTAQKRKQNIQDVPVAVTALTSTDINQTASLDIYDLQGYVPAFSALQSQSATNASFSIRGIGTSSQNFGFESSVGLYVDGVYRARQNAIINDIVDVESIEILRGPQGTLFGKNTPAGAISFHSRKPTFSNGDGFVSATAGNDNLTRVSGATSINAIDNVLAFRISGFSTHRDGWIDDVYLGNNTINDRDRSGARFQVLYKPSSKMRIRIIADYAELDEHCCGALTWQDNRQSQADESRFGTDTLLMMPPFNATLFTKEDFFSNQTALSRLPRSTMIDKGVSAQLDWQLSPEFTLTSVSAWRGFDSLDITDTDFTNADLLETTNDADQQAISQEVRLTYQSERFSALGGMYFYSQNLNLNFDITTLEQFPSFFAASASQLLPIAESINQLSDATGGLIAPAAAATPAQTEFAHTAYQQQDSMAAFVQTDWMLSSQLTLTTGLRFTHEKKTLESNYNEQGPGIDGLAIAPEQQPSVASVAQALPQIAAALAAGNMPNEQALKALVPFQQAGWGYYFLGTPAVLPRDPLSEERKDNQVTGTVKLSWQPKDTQTWYASVGSGFKAGGMNTDRIAQGLVPQFDEESALAYELGLKQEMLDRKLRINAALHYTTIKDFQASTFTGFGFNLQNAGDIETKGLEVELTWFATPNTRVGFNYARTLARFDSFERGTCWTATPWHTGVDDPGRTAPDVPYCSRSGDRLGFTPENSAGLTVSHTFMLADYANMISVDYQYTGDLFLDDSNDPLKYSESFDLVNLRWQLTLPQWETDVTLWAKNLLNEDYVARNGFDVPVQTGKVMAYPGQPVSYGITLRKTF